MNLEDLRKRWAELNAKYPVGKSRREADPYVKDALTPQLLSVLTPREAKVMRCATVWKTAVGIRSRRLVNR